MDKLKPVILFRKNLENEEEFNAACDFSINPNIPVYTSRSLLDNNLVIGRFSVLPFYKELENDLEFNKCKLINSYRQHQYIANFDYYEDIKQYTPKTWFRLEDVPDGGPYVVKGRTNSRKTRWDTLMYAKDRRQAINIAVELMDDSLIGPQGIIVRKYAPLKLLQEGINGQRFVNEWRLFYLGDELLGCSYYWGQIENTSLIKFDVELTMFANKIAKIVKNKVNFFVIDVAQKENGEWIVIELNDAQMSGLSMLDPKILYTNLNSVLKTVELK